VEEGECYSCGLYLDDVPVCPGCGAIQTRTASKVTGPRCGEHHDRVAVFTCRRCHRHGCAQCEVEDTGGCWTCEPSPCQALVAELKAVRRRMLLCLFAFAVSAPAVALHAKQVPIAAVLFVFSGCIMSLSVNAYLHRDFSAFALALMGLTSVVLIFLLSETYFAVGPLLLAGSLFVQMNRASWLLIERWRSARARLFR
jgi:hypothetical protein